MHCACNHYCGDILVGTVKLKQSLLRWVCDHLAWDFRWHLGLSRLRKRLFDEVLSRSPTNFNPNTTTLHPIQDSSRIQLQQTTTVVYKKSSTEYFSGTTRTTYRGHQYGGSKRSGGHHCNSYRNQPWIQTAPVPKLSIATYWSYYNHSYE